MVKVALKTLLKMAVAAALFLGGVVAWQVSMKWALATAGLASPAAELLQGVSLAVVSVFLHRALLNLFGATKSDDFSLGDMREYLAVGVLIGCGLQALTILVIYGEGGYSVVSVNSPWIVIPTIPLVFASATVEEIVFRGIIFRMFEESAGTYAALFLSSLLFGIAHLGNSGSSFATGVGLAVQAGLMLASSYVCARTLWLPAAIHFGWNFTQTSIFGASVSGVATATSFITARIAGPDWCTGGQFGPEGSLQATLFCLVAAIAFLAMGRRKARIVSRPLWSAA